MCDLDYGYMGFTRNIIKIKGKTIQYTDMSLESACENENNVLLLNSFSSNIYTQGDVHVKGTNSYMNVKKQINVKPNTTYVVSVNIESINKGDNNYSPRLQIKKGNTIICSTNSSATFNSGDNTTLDVAMYVNSAIESTTECEANFKNIKIQEKNEIQLPQPLRSLPNGVCDTIEGNKLIQRVGVQLLDGSESWYIASSAPSSDTNMLFCCELEFRAKNKTNLYCNNFLPSNAWHNTSLECIAIGRSALNGFDIRINKSRLSTQDVTGIKEWLSHNPTIVYYELASPVETTINVNIKKIKKSKCYNNIKPTII